MATIIPINATSSGGGGSAWRGIWQLSTEYHEKDQIAHAGDLYLCSSSHTSDGDTEPGIGISWSDCWALQVDTVSVPQKAALDANPNLDADNPVAAMTDARFLTADQKAAVDNTRMPINADNPLADWASLVGTVKSSGGEDAWDIAGMYVFDPDNPDSYCVARHNGYVYAARVPHVASAISEPGIGSMWEIFWELKYGVLSTDEKAALVGTSGAPGADNKFVTDADPRLDVGSNGITLAEIAAPDPPTGDHVIIYAVDNSGSTEIWAKFANGATKKITDDVA